MEVLDKKIEEFLKLGYGSGSGSGDGYGSGYGDGHGSGHGSGSGDGYGSGYGDGHGSGHGYGHGDGHGHGHGSGYGSGYGHGDGYGDGHGSGIEEFNGDKVYYIDDMPTLIKYVRGNIAEGFILEHSFKIRPCFIAKGNGLFAHGDTLHDAMQSLQEKMYDDRTETERIEAFVREFPEYDKPYPNVDLFRWHHILTGSCRFGREQFCKVNDIDLSKSTTVRDFITLTKGSYGGNIIAKLPEIYKH